MAGIEWKERPVLDEPVALIAFSGWGDAGEAASMAAVAFLEAFDSDVVAVIDSDDYYDFQVRRPVVEIEDDGIRQILWPDMEIHALRGADQDMVVVVGEEPHYRWKTLAQEIVGALGELGVKRVISIGAFVGQVAHTLPVPLIGSSNRPERLAPWGLMPSNYEGPTGIIGVLTNEFGSAGMEAMSVWAAVPHYLSNQEYPPATEALVLKVAELLGIHLDSSELEDVRRQFLLTVEEAIAANDDLVRYVQRLEEEADGVDTEDSLRLVEEIERFLRDQAP